MAFHERWTTSDLIRYMIMRDYPGYTELYTFESVLHNKEFYAVTLIQKDESRLAVFSQRICNGYKYSNEPKEIVEFSSKTEGNEFYKKIKASEKVSKKNSYYYRY